MAMKVKIERATGAWCRGWKIIAWDMYLVSDVMSYLMALANADPEALLRKHLADGREEELPLELAIQLLAQGRMAIVPSTVSVPVGWSVEALYTDAIGGYYMVHLVDIRERGVITHHSRSGDTMVHFVPYHASGSAPTRWRCEGFLSDNAAHFFFPNAPDEEVIVALADRLVDEPELEITTDLMVQISEKSTATKTR
jgi:hypothetical protein